MANATAVVKKGAVDFAPPFVLKRSTETLASETTFYKHAFVGIDETGYYCKGDDSQSWIFAGIVYGDQGNPVLAACTAGDARNLDVHRPRFLEVAIASVAVTDIGKVVYADDDQTGTLAVGDTTYSNVIGQVVDVVASGIALVELAYDGIAANRRLGAAKRLAATGAQTISKYDMGKILFCANTATLTLTTPAIAGIQTGNGFTLIKDHTSDTNAITIDPPDSENIDGATTLASLDAAYDTVELVSNETRWIVRYRDIA